jgi:hypothetical protein
MLEQAMRTLGALVLGALLSTSSSFGLLGLSGCAGGPARTTSAADVVPEDARQYYPLEPGWRWAYDVERAGERILAVYSVRERRGSTALLDAGGETIRYDVLPEGIARAAVAPEADKRAGSQDFLLRSPVRAGARWPITEGTATVTAVGRTVTVPAGTFANCVTVEEAKDTPARLIRTTYAPGVGPVTIDSLVQIPGRNVYESNLRAALRGVTRPGEDPLQ